MIVWGGGGDGILQTGARYNPTTDSWTATSTTNAPAARLDHTAVWTGSEMVVWAGLNENFEAINTGGRYNPSTDSWTATNTTNAPTARALHTALSIGNEMIVWGGAASEVFNTGGRYNLNTDSWNPTSVTGAPTQRYRPTSVSTGTEMIVWGGYDSVSLFDTGGRYNPSTDSWASTTTTNAPTNRYTHTAVWTGVEMIVWGGYENVGFVNTGGRYCGQSGPPLTLDARVRRQNGKHFVALTWGPADGGGISVLRNGVVLAITDDDGSAQDKLGTRTGTFFYQVCETGSGECSNQVRVVVQGAGE